MKAQIRKTKKQLSWISMSVFSVYSETANFRKMAKIRNFFLQTSHRKFKRQMCNFYWCLQVNVFKEFGNLKLSAVELFSFFFSFFLKNKFLTEPQIPQDSWLFSRKSRKKPQTWQLSEFNLNFPPFVVRLSLSVVGSSARLLLLASNEGVISQYLLYLNTYEFVWFEGLTACTIYQPWIHGM